MESNISHLRLKNYRSFAGILTKDVISTIFWYFSILPLTPARLDRLLAEPV